MSLYYFKITDNKPVFSSVMRCNIIQLCFLDCLIQPPCAVKKSMYTNGHNMMYSLTRQDAARKFCEVCDLVVETAVRVTKRTRKSEVGERDGGRWWRNVTFFRRNASYILCFQLIRGSRHWLWVPRTSRIHFWCLLLGTLSEGKSEKWDKKWGKGRNRSLTLQAIAFLSRNGGKKWQYKLNVNGKITFDI